MFTREQASDVLTHALGKGADFAEVYLEDKTATSISLEDRAVEEISDGSSRGAGVRVVYGDTTGFAHTSDISTPGLIAAAETARAVARGGSTRKVEVGGSHGASSWDSSNVSSSDFKRRGIELLQGLDEIARSEGGEIVQVVAGMSSARKRFAVANSDGVFVTDQTVRTRLVISAVAKGDIGLQTGYEPAAFTMNLDDFINSVDVENIAKTASRRAILKLRARPAPSGTLPVVIKRGSGGILFHEACGHGLEADHIVKNASVYTGRVGQRVASPLVTLVDDGTVSSEWGTLGFDDEGKPGQHNVLIENGVLTDYMWDFLSARKEGRPSSGNGRRQSYKHLPMVRMTNTFLMQGTSDPQEIIAQTEHGVYVESLTGGQVNTATGDFVFGTQEAYLIEGGKITAPIRDTQLIGNGPDTLTKIDAIGNDFAMTPGTCGKMGQSVPVGTGQPTLRITEMTLGGTSGA